MMPDRDKILVSHILDAIGAVERFVKGKSKEDFLKDEMLYSAVIKKFEIIGEAASRLSNEFRNVKKDVPWGEIIGMRNILIHDYFGTDLESIWDAIGEDFPKLREKLT